MPFVAALRQNAGERPKTRVLAKRGYQKRSAGSLRILKFEMAPLGHLF